MKTPNVGDVIQRRFTSVFYRVDRFTKLKKEIKVILVPLDEEFYQPMERTLPYVREEFIPFRETDNHKVMLGWTVYCSWAVWFFSSIWNKPTIVGMILGLLGAGVIWLTHLLLLKMYKKGLLNHKRYLRRVQ